MSGSTCARSLRSWIAFALVAVGMMASSPSGFAQDVNSGVSIGPSEQLSTPAPPLSPMFPPAPSVEQLFGDWGGVRTYLSKKGVEVLVDLTTEFAGNVTGGTQKAASFANQVGYEVDIDWHKLAGINGLASHVVVVSRSGNNTSAMFGDRLIPVQEIYGSGGNVLFHLVYAYFEEKLADARAVIAAGRMPVSIDFAASPLYCNFMSNSLCGNPKSLPGGSIGFSSYPDATWAIRGRFRPTPATYVQFGAYEVNRKIYTYPRFRSGWNWGTDGGTGVFLPVEAAWEPLFGQDRLPGHYKVGFGYDTSNYPDLFADVTGNAAALTGQPYRLDRGRSQVWALFDQMLLRHGKGSTDGLIVLGGAIHNDPMTSVYAEQYLLGLLDSGFWKARPQDTIGLLFSYDTVSGRLGKTQALQQEFGLQNTALPVPGIQTHEMILEVNYDIHVFRGVNVQPEFQYVFRPNAQGNIKDAAVLGFKGHVAF